MTSGGYYVATHILTVWKRLAGLAPDRSHGWSFPDVIPGNRHPSTPSSSPSHSRSQLPHNHLNHTSYSPLRTSRLLRFLSGASHEVWNATWETLIQLTTCLLAHLVHPCNLPPANSKPLQAMSFDATSKWIAPDTKRH
jgi:hypothetical protein